MTTYRVSDGHDVALVSLSVLNPQPKSAGVKAADRTYAADGSVYETPQYVELEWDVFETPAEYTTVLTAFGLNDNVLQNEVTIYARDHAFRWKRYNGVAVHPRLGVDGEWSNFFARGFILLVKELELLA